MVQPYKKDFRSKTMVLMVSLLLAVVAFPNGFYSTNLSAATTAMQFLPFADTCVKSDEAPRNFGSNAAVRLSSGSIFGTAFMKYDQPSLANKIITNAALPIRVGGGSNPAQSVKLVSNPAWCESQIINSICHAILTVLATISPIIALAMDPSNTPILMAEPITAAIETDPVSHSRDAADDPLVWIHPTDPSLSTVMGNDKQGAYEVYDIRTGVRLQSIAIDVRNTDIRYNFPLGGQTVTLVTGFSVTRGGLIAWKVNPSTRMLEEVTATGSSMKSRGGAMYHSPVTGEYYWFSNSNGTLYQYRLSDNGSGRVAATLVRTISYGGRTDSKGEATVADDVHGYVYISEETVGMWKLNAEPEGGSTKTMVDKPVSQGGHFTPDLEGLAIYYKSDGTGYLFASSQGSNNFNIYQREGNNAYIGSFAIEDGVVDGTSATDGIEVNNFPMGSQYPYGVFIAQDGENFDGGIKENQNFKIVPFERIAKRFGLTMDINWDPRAVGR